jgi:DNA-binding SARP family transcriptional activator
MFTAAFRCPESIVGIRVQRFVAEHPFNERFRAQLMLALYRSGRQADALAAYTDARETLVGELGISPSRPLQLLEQAILRQEPLIDEPPAGGDGKDPCDTHERTATSWPRREAEWSPVGARALSAAADAAPRASS